MTIHSGSSTETDVVQVEAITTSTTVMHTPATGTPKKDKAAVASSSSFATVGFWLSAWTLHNIGVTLVNKAAFSIVSFPYPYALTGWHMLCSALGCEALFVLCRYSTTTTTISLTLPPRPPTTSWTIVAFSLLFTLNIAVGNVSLRHSSVNFNQTVRSLVPVVTMWMTMALSKRSRGRGTDSSRSATTPMPIVSLARQRAVWPVVAGVALACVGQEPNSVSMTGWVAAVACVLLASAKVVVSAHLLTTTTTTSSTTTQQQPQQYHPLHLLSLLAPLALCQCVIWAVVTGEATAIAARWHTELNPWIGQNGVTPALVLLLSGVLAFLLNVCALQAYKVAGALHCCIAAAVKQVLMIVAGTILFATPVSTLNATGIVVVLVASAYYSYISVLEKQDQKDKLLTGQHGSDDDSSGKYEKRVPLLAGSTQESVALISPDTTATVGMARRSKMSALSQPLSREYDVEDGSELATTLVVDSERDL